jgi:archaellum component FlaC
MRILQTLIATTILSSSLAVMPARADEPQPMAPAADESSKPATEDGVRKDVKETIDAIKSKEALDDFDARMDKLEKYMTEKKSVWSEKFAKKKEAELEELKKSRADVAERYENLKKASKKVWEATKEAFVSSYRKLEHKLDKLRSGTSESEEDKSDGASSQPATRPQPIP